MATPQYRDLIISLIARIAPEADLSNLDPDLRFRDQFDFDSIDCLNLVMAIARELQFTIPEADYPRLATLNGCLHYLAGRDEAAAPPDAAPDHREGA